MNDIAVSVFCSTYNQADYISDAIESFLAQETDFEYEILINDDSSTDGTAEIALGYERAYPGKITVVTHAENMFSKGILGGAAPYFLYPLARGRYFAWCEGDDYWVDRKKLQKQFDVMERDESASFCVHSSLCVQPATKKVIGVNRFHDIDGYVEYDEMLGNIQCFATSSFFVRRSAYESYLKSKIIGIKAHGDQKLSLFFGSQGRVHYIDEAMSAYRVAAKGSYNKSLLLNPDRNAIEKDLCESRVALLTAIDELTDGAHKEGVAKGKEAARYAYYASTSQYHVLKRDWDCLFKEERFMKRARIRIVSICPHLFEPIYRLAKRMAFAIGRR
ncbi:glycosyltransferase family 2 protein [Eggerthella guodeyinii]|nr:glycosyltransferase [Eggerthella guodeyinii]